ncbi:MAG: single-stranded-DNA-specific exonuclease RecJ [Chthoniobacteraceae bacterium]
MRWIIAPAAAMAEERGLARELGVAPFIAALLCRRGLLDAAAARDFLQPKLKSLGDPFELPNMEAATARILAAIDRKERIALYGDYDVDGVASLALFARVLRAYGAEAGTFLPQRMDEGYGLSPEGVTRCLTELRPQLLVALDCGTSSVAEIASLRAGGVDVVVFDHHEIKGALPDCALVNPKLGTKFHYLCTAGIVFKACHALLKRRPLENFDLKECLDIVALGTVADIVPLVEENRILVQKGLVQMEKTRWTGLRALMQVAGVKAPISPGDVGFRLGPRLNAAGRIGTAGDALKLLLTEDAAEARMLAAGLDQQNQERQQVEQRTLRAAEKMVAENFDAARDATIVIGESGWHPGVLGIVASRISKSFHRPTFVIGFDENGVGKGSGRSITGFSLVEALSQCGGFLEKFGGHEMAAGLTIRQERFPEFQRAFLDFARAQLTDEDLQPRLRVDGEVEIGELDLDFLGHHEKLQPFGIGNPQPLFFARGVKPFEEPRVLKEKHLLFNLRQNGSKTSAIFFNGAATELPRPPWDVAFRVERNEFRENVTCQVQIVALRGATE